MDKRIESYFLKMLEKNKEVVINRDNIIDIFGEDIERIDLSGYIIHKITSNCFSNFNNLKFIKLMENRELKIIEPYSFTNCTKLKEIEIIGTKISKLKKNTFYKLPDLGVLRLNNCLKLQSIFPNFINKCNNLRSIEINYSGILRLNKNTFFNLPNLRYLTINNNENLCIIESEFINNCMILEILSIADNINLSSIDICIAINCNNIREIYLQNCNIQILHIDSFKSIYRLAKLNIENNSLLINYLDDEIRISDNNNLYYYENNFILDIIRENLGIDKLDNLGNDLVDKHHTNPEWSNLIPLSEEPLKTYKFIRRYFPMNINIQYLTHYEYCINLFRNSPDRNNHFESFMNLLSQIDEIDNSIIIENIFIILFIIILFLLRINIYYNRKSLEYNILHLLSIVNDSLSIKYVKNSLSLLENISDKVGEYLDTNKYIIKYKDIIITIIGYLVDIYKGSSNFDNIVSKFDNIMEYLFINNMKNKRKLRKIGRTIEDKRLELLYIIKEINGSLELPKLKEGEIGLLLHYLIKLIDFKKMNKINNAIEIEKLSKHRNIQKRQLMRELVKIDGEESINNTIINYYDKVSDMYISKLLSNNIKYRINRKNLD